MKSDQMVWISASFLPYFCFPPPLLVDLWMDTPTSLSLYIPNSSSPMKYCSVRGALCLHANAALGGGIYFPLPRKVLYFSWFLLQFSNFHCRQHNTLWERENKQHRALGARKSHLRLETCGREVGEGR